MAKDTFYFSHDYNSRNDIKIKHLIAKHGMLGYGIFWALIEELYNNANVLRLDYDTIAFDLRIDQKLLQNIVHDFDLFVFNGDTFGSMSVQKRIDERNEKSKKARDSARYRWNKDTNALQTQSDSNAIKERKGKKRKGKERKKEDLNFPFSSPEFFTAWDTLVKTKKWSRKENSALQASLNKLGKNPEPDAIKMIENCIAGGWMGLVELKPHERSGLVKNGTGQPDLVDKILGMEETFKKQSQQRFGTHGANS